MNAAVDELVAHLDRWEAGKRIVVAGDFMLDRHTYGHADRLSPDAPVPVLAVQRVEDQPGGASNVCRDLLALDCAVSCLGVTGDDEAGAGLRAVLEREGAQTQGLIACPDRPTTLKHSYVGLAQHRHPQKMFRVDHETRRPLSDAEADRLLAAAETLLPGASLLCLEDYHKGVLTEPVCRGLIAAARRHGVPVLVDPAAIGDYGKYRGATAATPNRTEAALAAGVEVDSLTDPERLITVGRGLWGDLELETLLITLDKQGMLLFEAGDELHRDPNGSAAEPVQATFLPTHARSVYDVSGAGDMVLAMLAAARSQGLAWRAAAELANVAAGLEVERFGCVPVRLDEVLLALLEQQHAGHGKLRRVEQLLPELVAHRAAGKRVVFTNGCFDLLHAGHVQLLREARELGDLLVLAVNDDASIRGLKGPERPIVPLSDRLMVLSELACVDYLVTFGDGNGGEADTPKPLLRQIRPEILVKGGDYDTHEVVGHEIVHGYGGEVRTIPVVQGRSTTNLIDRIRGSV